MAAAVAPSRMVVSSRSDSCTPEVGASDCAPPPAVGLSMNAISTSPSCKSDRLRITAISCTRMRSGCTPSSVAICLVKAAMKAVYASPSCDSPLVSSTTSTTSTSLAQVEPSPSHTAHSSMAPLSQHKPCPSRMVAQHRPATSTVSALPPHTPHTSTSPVGQQSALPSSLALAPAQHAPAASSRPSQHTPSASTTPPHSGGDPQKTPW
mmetsp:Transcript_9864/g.20567  ORF Transcript_9864/g.20567 Transcript_9864/m.20567 type:complete len:208 (-) Transcript_9864:18-641(-)